MNRFLKSTLAAAVGGLAFMSTAAYAVPVSNAFTPGVINTFSDDNAEIHVDNNNDGLINEGDYLIGVIAFTTFGPGGGSAANFNQLSGIYGVEVDTATAVPGNVCASVNPGSCTTYTFTPIADLAAAVLAATGVSITDPVADGTTVAVLFEHDEHPDNPGALPGPVEGGTIGGNFALAADGTQRLTIGLVGANGDSFSGNAPADITDFALVGPGEGIGSITVNLTITQQDFPGWNLGPDIRGSGNISPPAAGPFPIRSDTSFSLLAQRVPEPGTVSLLGLAFLAFGIFTRRNRVGT